jgi:hypothetical protein
MLTRPWRRRASALFGFGDLVVDGRRRLGGGRTASTGQVVDLIGCPVPPLGEEEVRCGSSMSAVFGADDRAYAVQPARLGFQSLAG